MEIKKLPHGELAPVDSDCIKIITLPDGRFKLVSSALRQCPGDDEASSDAVVSSDVYPDYAQAERAGLAWAEAHCVAILHIETGEE